MTLITPKEITTKFLYNQSTRPTNLVSDTLIRSNPLPDPQPKITLDMNEFMETGPGRFAKGAGFPLIGNFFTEDFSTVSGFEYGKAYNADQIAGFLDFPLWRNLHKIEIITQSIVHDDVDDWAARAYMFNTGSYTISDDSKFIVSANGKKRIEDFSVRAFDDTFDFDGTGLTNVGNWMLHGAIDPSTIGRIVDIDIRGDVSESIYDIDKDGSYDIDDFKAELEIMNKWKHGLHLLDDLLPKINSLVTDLWNDGTIKFLDAQDRPIIYGTDKADHLTTFMFVDTVLNVPKIKNYIQNGVVLIGGKGNDTLTGGSNNDSLMGGDENDSIFGGAGSDTLRGEDGNDVLEGESDADTLDGGTGNDTLSGGFDNGDTYILSSGTDAINDSGAGDKIDGYAGEAVEQGEDTGIYSLHGVIIVHWADNDNQVYDKKMKFYA